MSARTAAASSTPWYFNWDLNHVVDVCDDSHAELTAIRQTIAMGDMSPLCKAAVSGPDAARFVDPRHERRNSRKGKVATLAAASNVSPVPGICQGTVPTGDCSLSNIRGTLRSRP